MMLMRLASLLPVAALLIYTIGGCRPSSSSTSRRVWTEEDAWYRAPPSGTHLWEWSELDGDRVHEVIASKKADAEGLLQDVSSVALTDQQAAEFTGEPLPDLPGTKPYLTRGVLLNRGTGGFTVYTSGDQVVVYHGSLGKSAVPMSRQPLVLQLERDPVEVFVACSMAE
jgi:hypothetical protein